MENFEEESDDCRFAASVALFGMLLRKSQYAGKGNTDMVVRIAKRPGPDPGGYRGEFLKLIKQLKKHTEWLR